MQACFVLCLQDLAIAAAQGYPTTLSHFPIAQCIEQGLGSYKRWLQMPEDGLHDAYTSMLRSRFLRKNINNLRPLMSKKDIALIILTSVDDQQTSYKLFEFSLQARQCAACCSSCLRRRYM